MGISRRKYVAITSSFRLGFGLAPSPGKGGGDTPVSLSWFARMDTQPSPMYRKAYNDLARDGAINGWLGRGDGLLILAAENSQSSRLNLCQNAFNATIVGDPVFEAGKGWTFSANNYLDTGFNPASAVNAKYKRDDCSAGVFSLTAKNGDADFGNLGSSAIRYNGSFVRPQVSSNISTGGAAYPGEAFWNRTSANLWSVFADEKVIGGGTQASTALTSTNFWVGGASNSTYGNNTLAAIWWGGSLTETQALAKNRAIRKFLRAVGALPSAYSLPNGSLIALGGQQFVSQNGNKPYSAQADYTKPGTPIIRMEVRQGETPGGAGIDRSELVAPRSSKANRTRVKFTANVENFENNASFFVLAQWHGGDDASPRNPFIAWFLAGNTLSLRLVNYDPLRPAQNNQSEAIILYSEPNFARNVDTVFETSHKIGEFDGELDAWLRGVQVANYRGPLGFWDEVPDPYFKFGEYRGTDSSTAVITYKDIVPPYAA